MLVTDRFDRDTNYWNDYYSRSLNAQEPSLFAIFVYEKYMKKNEGKVLELGCGNGRDSLYFLKQGLEVTGIDASKVAIDELNIQNSSNTAAKFLCKDFVNINDEEIYDYCYSRFSMHAINEEQEDRVIKKIASKLKVGGFFFIEVRSVNDEIYGKGRCIGKNEYIWENHYRRFICISDLIRKLVESGFIIDFAAERRGFAPYRQENPFVIRVVAQKYI